MTVLSINHFSNKLSNKEALNRCSSTIRLVRELYEQLGEDDAYERYGKVWDLIPQDSSVKDLDSLIYRLRGFLKTEEQVTEKVFVICVKNTKFVYKNVTKSRMKRLLAAAIALKQDLQIVKEVR